MAGFAGQVEFVRTVRGRIKRNAKLIDQDFFYQTWAFLTQQRRCRQGAQPCAHCKNIRDELVWRFVAATIDDPALRAVRVAVFGLCGAGEKCDFAVPFRSCPGRCQASQPAADDENIGLEGVIHFRGKSLGETAKISQRNGSISKLKSMAGAECVRAPTEIQSTPASANCLTLSRVMPPDASVRIVFADL